VKVLFLTPGCFDKGGISRYSRYQIAALRELLGEDQVRVLSLLGPDAESFEEAFPVRWHGRGNRFGDKCSMVGHAFKEAMSFRPQVIWSAHVNLSGVVRVAAGLIRAESVLNVYGLEVWSGFSRDAAWGLAHTRHVLADCHWTAQYLEREGLRPGGTVGVIWDCVNTDKFCPAPPQPDTLARYGIPDPATGINILSLGRMSKNAAHKGYERLLDVFGRIATRVPRARLVYAGRGDLVSGLRQKAAQAGLGERVFFTGMIHDDDLPDIYRSACVFSLVGDRGVGRGEGIPLTPLEAAACGVPILVGNQDGSQEAVREGENGFVLDPFDLDGHASVLERLCLDTALRARMSEGAARVVRAEFSFDIFRRKHEQLLSSWGCLGQKR
jgi:phosphatidyl-myo-inositol dimannoside synthase